MDREGYGPEFDDRLIKLVKENAAIYDFSHPHYRRTPVRTAIWENIAKELGAPSRFLQTKWKNIRYNYLQELKCQETGVVNTNIRKRRFTEDLSFLKYTAYRRDGVTPTKPNGNNSDDSNSYMYPDNLAAANTYEVIELDQSDDETDEFMPDISAFLAPMNDTLQNSPQDPYGQPDKPEDANCITNKNDESSKEQQLKPQLTINQSLQKTDKNTKSSLTPANSPGSNRSSPLLTPILTNSAVNKNKNETQILSNGSNNHLYSEVTIQPLPPASPLKRRSTCSPLDPMLTNNIKRKTSATTLTSANNDPIELYCLSLVDCLRAMPRSERERVKFEFAKILKDANYKDQT